MGLKNIWLAVYTVCPFSVFGTDKLLVCNAVSRWHDMATSFCYFFRSCRMAAKVISEFLHPLRWRFANLEIFEDAEGTKLEFVFVKPLLGMRQSKMSFFRKLLSIVSCFPLILLFNNSTIFCIAVIFFYCNCSLVVPCGILLQGFAALH